MVDIAARPNLNSYNPDQYTNWDELRGMSWLEKTTDNPIT